MKPPMPLLIRGDARSLPLPDSSIDCVITSPPYFALRSYTDGGEHYAGQIGSETTPGEWLDAMIECTREMMRVLKPSGSLFVNLGDKYVADNRGSGIDVKRGQAKHAPRGPAGFVGLDLARQKSLLLLPERYRIRCVDELGLIARAVIVWHKPNGLPESVTDRVRRSHEDWVHLTKQPRYYSAVDEIREPAEQPQRSRPGVVETDRDRRTAQYGVNAVFSGQRERVYNPLGKLPGSVWEIATQPLTVPAELGVDHFAAFPMALPRRLITGWCPREVCTGCGEGRWPVVDRTPMQWRPSPTISGRTVPGTSRTVASGTMLAPATTLIVGYACACTPYVEHDDDHGRPWREYLLAGWTPPPATPGVVLDPFGGTGTTALVATMLGRRGISVDLSADYCRLARWRASDPKERARAAGLDPDAVAAIKTPLADQLDLFGEVS